MVWWSRHRLGRSLSPPSGNVQISCSPMPQLLVVSGMTVLSGDMNGGHFPTWCESQCLVSLFSRAATSDFCRFVKKVLTLWTGYVPARPLPLCRDHRPQTKTSRLEIRFSSSRGRFDSLQGGVRKVTHLALSNIYHVAANFLKVNFAGHVGVQRVIACLIVVPIPNGFGTQKALEILVVASMEPAHFCHPRPFPRRRI